MRRGLREWPALRGRPRTKLVLLVVVPLAAILLLRPSLLWSFWIRLRGRATVAERVEEYGAPARERLLPPFTQAGIPYPPAAVRLVGLKQEALLEVYARADHSEWRWITTYPILALSGGPGPKLRDGDLQVPEGLYEIEALNPNSRFHLSLRLNYPSVFDRRRAEAEGRTQLGGDIMIHGSDVSIGCLAVGDRAIEDLFILTADVGIPHVDVVLAPSRVGPAVVPTGSRTVWDVEMDQGIDAALAELR